MMDFSIEEIARAAGGQLFLREGENGDRCVTSVILDSRKAEEGCVFLAVPGERVDGHKFIPEVSAGGVALVVTQKTPEQVEAEHGYPAAAWGSYLLVEDTLTALKKIAESYRRKLPVKVVGITGSVGKTSTKEFIAGVLAEKYRVLKTEGNFNNEIGVPLTLLRIRPDTQVAVVEMGISDFGEMHRLSRMARPDICVMTNIGQCHLENLKSREGILRAKSEIFDFMAEDGEVCLNGGDDMLAGLSEVKGRKPHFFGLGENPMEEVSAGEIVSHGLWGSDAVLSWGGSVPGKVKVHIPLPGLHMVRNSAAAACVGRLMGLTGEEIAAGISRLTPVSGRNHLIPLGQYTLIDDCYNANPGSMQAALDLLSMAEGPKAAILGDMFELGENSGRLHAGIGEYAARKGLQILLCTGRESRHMYEAAAREGKIGLLRYFETRQALLDYLEQNGEQIFPKQCAILVKASHGMEFTGVLKCLERCLGQPEQGSQDTPL